MLERIYRSMRQELPKIKGILELNPDHRLVIDLQAAHAPDPSRSDLAETAQLVHDMALLADGGELADPARFIRHIADRLASTL